MPPAILGPHLSSSMKTELRHDLLKMHIRKRKRYGVKKDKYYAHIVIINSISIYVLKSKGSATFLKYMQGFTNPL